MTYQQAVQQIINISPSVGSGGAPASNISALDAVGNITVPYRTEFGANGVTVGLPATLGCSFDGGGSGTVDMTWAIGSYNSGAQGSVVAFYSDGVYNIVGTPVTTGSITNTGNITKSVQVTVKTPFFPLTATVRFVVDWQQMVANTDNDYGTVNATPGITAIKGVSPGTITVTIPVVGTAPILSGGRAQMIGTGSWRQSVAGALFDFLHYNAVQANLKWTAIIAGRFLDKESDFGGIFGNNGHSSANNGVTFNYRSLTVDEVRTLITGNSTNAINGVNGGVIVYDTNIIIGTQIDHALASTSGKVKHFRGTTEFTSTSTDGMNLDNSPVAGTFGVGNFGSGSNLMTGNLAFMVFLEGVESDAVRNKFIEDIAFYTGTTL